MRLKVEGWRLNGGGLVTGYVWVIIDETYDEAYRIGFADGRDYAHFGEMRPRETARETGVINSPKVINSPSAKVERKGK